MIGTKLNKPIEDFAAYAELAKWCQRNGAIITDKGEYYECVALEITLDALKTEKLSEFKRRRDAEEVENITYNGHPYDYDQKSRERLHIARQALQDGGEAGASIVWTTADNERVTLTVADFAAINGLAAQRSNALHVRYNRLKERVNAAETAEDVGKIKWEGI
ncbi:MAG: DUF4376 domain-containing protein [Schwartzia sp. (in: firmicutes)]